MQSTQIKPASKTKTGGLLRLFSSKGGNNSEREGIHFQQHHVAAMGLLEAWAQKTTPNLPDAIRLFPQAQQGYTKAQQKELAELRTMLDKTDGIGIKSSAPQQLGTIVMSFFHEFSRPILNTEFIDELEKVVSGKDQSKFVIQLERLDSGERGIMKKLALFVRNFDANVCNGNSGFREAFFRIIYTDLASVISLSPTEKEDEITRGSVLLSKAVDFLPAFMLFTGRAQGKLLPMKGETVLRGYENVIFIGRDLSLIENAFPGELWITNYRIVFRYPPGTGHMGSDMEFTDIPLRSIASIERDAQERIRIVTGTFGVYHITQHISIPDTLGRVLRDIKSALEDAQKNPYALNNTELPHGDPATVNIAAKEMARLGLPEEAFRVSDANRDFSITTTYPQHLIVPRVIEDSCIHRQGLEFVKRRFPYLAWHNAAAGTGLYRSFPLLDHNEVNRLYTILFGFNGGALQIFSIASEEWVRQHKQGKTTGLALPTPTQVRDAFFDLVDTEFVLGEDSAIALASEAALEEAKRGNIAEALAIIAGRGNDNSGTGGDDSSSATLPNSQSSADSIGAKDGSDGTGSNNGGLGSEGGIGIDGSTSSVTPDMKGSGNDTLGSGIDTIIDGTTVSANKLPKPKWRDFPPFNTEWNRQIGRLVDAAAAAVAALGRSSVLLEQSNSDWCGADCAVSSLVQIALDPYYRTIDGFAVLVTKEWVNSGFPFGFRSFLGDPNEPAGYSPIFLQFLSAVYRVFMTFPSRFEFTEEYLVFLADSLYSGRFGTFAASTTAEAEYFLKNTVSVWTYIRENRDNYVNQFYYPDDCETPTLDLQQCGRHVTWNFLYLRNHPVGKIIQRRLRQVMSYIINKKEEMSELAQPMMDFFYMPRRFGQIEGLVKLNLSKNHLVTLPPEIGNLKKLKELVLSENEFTSIPGSIFTILSKLPDLETLDFSKNSLSTLPEEIVDMESLKTLNISKNAFVVLPPALMRTKGLVSLNISYNRIEVISQNDVAQLTPSTSPSLANSINPIQGGNSGIVTNAINNGGKHGLALALAAGCPSFFDTLEDLQLDHNRLIAFPETFTYLRKLQKLNLSYNNLERFPTHFYRLRALRSLDASYNKLTLLPSSLTTLYRLEELNLEHNNLTKLPTSIGRLVQLRVLIVNNNKLTAIPSRIGQLSELETLNISRNNITALKDTMCMLTHINDFTCDGSARITYPSADLLSANYSVMAEAFREGLAARITTHRIKLIIVGSENVGKTSLLRSLKRKRTMGVVGGGASKAEIQYNLSTDGVKIEDWPFSMEFEEFDETTGKSLRVRKHDITVSAWDFAGQQIYGTTHQFFLSSKAVYLAVWDMQQPIDESSMYNWLWTIRMYAPTAPIIIVGTHKDKIQGGSSAAKRIIGEAIEKYGKTFAQSRVSAADIMGCSQDTGDSGLPPMDSLAPMGNTNFDIQLTGYPVSCINDEGVSKLRHGLEATLKRYPFARQNVTKAFLVLEKLILEEREGNLQPVLTWSEFCTLAAVCTLSTPELARRAAEYLNQLGTIVYFPQDPELSDLVVIDPQWLSDLFTTLVTTKSNYASSANGIMTTKNLLHLWLPPKFPQEMHRKLLTLLERFEIVFNISLRHSNDLHEDPVDILVPSTLPEQEPTEKISACWPQLRIRGPIRQVARVISFGQVIPPGFFLRLLVRVLKAMQTVPLYIWRHGLIIKSRPKAAIPGKEEAELSDTFLYVRERESGGVIDITVRGCEAALPEVCAFARTAFDAATSFFTEEIKEKVVVYVPCVHCILTKAQTPKMFVINECENAVIRGNKEVKCTNDKTVPLELLVPELDLGALAAPKADMNEIELESVVGQGATAIVNKGYYKDYEVAVKKLRMDTDDRKSRCGSQSFAEFRREAYVMSTFVHPCIVGLVAVCLRPLCLLTEFIPYGNLFELVNDPSKPLDFPMVIKIAHDVASGMAYLHSMTPPQLHRDLKSPNIFINGTSPLDLVVAKVADFGLTGNAYTIGQNVDNPIWLAPEVMQHQEPTMASDVYSFGVILWELIARKQFFSEISFMTVLESKVIAGERPEIPQSCPLAYRKLIQACWAPNPTKRPSFSDVVCTLESIIYDPDLGLEGKLTLCTDKTKTQTPRSFIKSVAHPLSLDVNDDIENDSGMNSSMSVSSAAASSSSSASSVVSKQIELGSPQKSIARSYSPSSESGASIDTSTHGSSIGDDSEYTDIAIDDNDGLSSSIAITKTEFNNNEAGNSTTPMIDTSEFEDEIRKQQELNEMKFNQNADNGAANSNDPVNQNNFMEMNKDFSLDEYEVPPQFDDMDDTFYEGIDSFQTHQKPVIVKPPPRILPKQLQYQIQNQKLIKQQQQQQQQQQPTLTLTSSQPPNMPAPSPPRQPNISSPSDDPIHSPPWQPIISSPPSIPAPQLPTQSFVSSPQNVSGLHSPEQSSSVCVPPPDLTQLSSSAQHPPEQSSSVCVPPPDSTQLSSSAQHSIIMKNQQTRKAQFDVQSLKSDSGDDDDDYYFHKTEKTEVTTSSPTQTLPSITQVKTTRPDVKTNILPTVSPPPPPPRITTKIVPSTVAPVHKVTPGFVPHAQPQQKPPPPPPLQSGAMPGVSSSKTTMTPQTKLTQTKIVPSSRLLAQKGQQPFAKRPIGAAPPPPTGPTPGSMPVKRPMGVAPSPPGSNSLIGSPPMTTVKISSKIQMAHGKQGPKMMPSGPIPAQKMVIKSPQTMPGTGVTSPKMPIAPPPGQLNKLRPSSSTPIVPGQKRIIPSFPTPHIQKGQPVIGTGVPGQQPPPPPQAMRVKVNCTASSDMPFLVSCVISISDEVVWVGHTDGQISIVNIKSNNIIKSFDAHEGNGGVLCMIKAGKKEILSAGRGIVKKWNLTGDLLSTTSTDTAGDVTSFVFAGVTLCGGTNRGMICVWNMNTADYYVVDTGFKNQDIAALAIFGKSLIAAVGSDLVFLSPSAQDGGKLIVNKVVKTPHEKGVHAIVAFSPVCFVTIDACFSTAIRWNSPDVKAVIYTASADEVDKSSRFSSAMGVNRVLVVYARNKFYFLEALNGRIVGTCPNYSANGDEYDTSLIILNHFPNSPNAKFMLAPKHNIHIGVWDMSLI